MRLAAVIILILNFAGPVYGQENIDYLGVMLPIPANEIWLGEDISVLSSTKEFSFEFLFFISAEGCTDSVTFTGPFDSNIVAPFWGALKGMDFIPASFSGVAIPFILPAILEIAPLGNSIRARLRWPVNYNDGRMEKGLMQLAQELNNFEYPGLEMMPSYFCPLDNNYEGDSLAFAVFRLVLDSTANIEEIIPVAGNHRHCAEIMASTILYGQYRPGSFRGQPITSELFLTIRFFKDLGYPTDIWPFSSKGAAGSIYNRLRLEISPYLPPLACPPLPKNISNGLFTSKEEFPFGDSVLVELMVNTRGRAMVIRFINPLHADREKAVKAIIRQWEFRPALNREGKPAYYEGRAILFFNYSRSIRISLNWLS